MRSASAASCVTISTVFPRQSRFVSSMTRARVASSSPLNGSSSAITSAPQSSARRIAGELPHRLVFAARQPHRGHLPQNHGALELRLGQADVIHRGHKIQQPILLKDRRQPFARKAGDFAAVRRFQPQQDAQQRRLARTGGRHQRRHAPLLQLAGEILQHGFAAEGLAQLMNRNHSRVSLLSSTPSAAMNSFSKPTLMSTITSVHANSSGVSR